MVGIDGMAAIQWLGNSSVENIRPSESQRLAAKVTLHCVLLSPIVARITDANAEAFYYRG